MSLQQVFSLISFSMKLNGMAGKGSGKLGSMVYATVRGAQIVRQYNPIVFNPNTEKQVLQRNRFTVLTKVAAALSAGMMFSGRKPMESNRNAFIRANQGAFTEGASTMLFNDLTLSGSSTDAEQYPVVSQPSQDGTITISMDGVTSRFLGFGYAVIVADVEGIAKPWMRAGIATVGTGTSAMVSVVLPRGEGWSEAYVIGYPIYLKDGASRVTYDKDLQALADGGDVSIYSLYNRMQSAGDAVVYATKPLAKQA